MTLPSSGAISLANVSVELGRSSTATTSLGETAVRTLAGVASGAISLSNLYGKSNALSITISPSSLNTTRFGAGSITSAAATGSAAGGAGGYTYAWSYISGSIYTRNTSSSASTTFTTNLVAEQYKVGVYRCTVTDSLGATAFANITVDFESF